MSVAPGMVLTPLIELGRTPADCWRWVGPVSHGGYPKKTYCGRDIPARRWMWMQLFGPIPDGLVISVNCGNQQCLNPHHLRANTQAEACRNGANTLLPQDVAEIRRARKQAGPGVRDALAERYGVSPTLISDIWGRRAWAKAKPFYGRSVERQPKVDAGGAA